MEAREIWNLLHAETRLRGSDFVNPLQALLFASYNIGIDCTSNNATGDAQNLNFAPRIGFAFSATRG